jgi:uncharacterized protein YdcH (DUF465 family)
MEQSDEELAITLLPQYPELKTAYEEHSRLKTQVERLTVRSYLSPGEEVEKKDLQKRKLAEKDKILRILDEHREAKEVGGVA